jgi:cation transport protein ChaC
VNTYHEDLPWLHWVMVRGGGEPIRALTFSCAPPGDPDMVHLPVEEQAGRLVRAVGFRGSCAEYLHNTVSHLEAMGIHDRYLWDLQARVAAKIDGL